MSGSQPFGVGNDLLNDDLRSEREVEVAKGNCKRGVVFSRDFPHVQIANFASLILRFQSQFELRLAVIDDFWDEKTGLPAAEKNTGFDSVGESEFPQFMNDGTGGCCAGS